MSEQNYEGHVNDLPLKEDGSVDFDKLPKDENGQTWIDRDAERAYEDGELEETDVLGNTINVSKKNDIVHEMFTGEEHPLPADRVLTVVKHLQGKVLTIVDASYDDKERAKFVKDLVKDAFSSSSNWIYEMSIRDEIEM